MLAVRTPRAYTRHSSMATWVGDGAFSETGGLGGALGGVVRDVLATCPGSLR